MGRIVAIGGGEIGLDETKPIDQYIVELSGCKKSNAGPAITTSIWPMRGVDEYLDIFSSGHVYFVSTI